MPRPFARPTNRPAQHLVSVRFSFAELAVIDAEARRLGLNRNDYLRRMVLEKPEILR